MGAACHHHACLSLFGRSQQVVMEFNPAKKFTCTFHMVMMASFGYNFLIVACHMDLVHYASFGRFVLALAILTSNSVVLELASYLSPPS
jgi:hypothetical protein